MLLLLLLLWLCAAGFLRRIRNRDDVGCVPGRLGRVCFCFWTGRMHGRALIVIIRMASFLRTRDDVIYGGVYGRCAAHRAVCVCVVECIIYGPLSFWVPPLSVSRG